MATTSPDNLRTPDSGDSYALVQDMGILADTVQNALIKRANAYVGTVAQRTAFESSAPTGTIWSDTDGDRLVWKKGSTGWERLARNTPKVLAGYLQANAKANEPEFTYVEFPPGFFTESPSMSVTANSTVVGSTVLGVGANAVTKDGFNVVIRRTNDTPTGVHWIAVERGEV